MSFFKLLPIEFMKVKRSKIVPLIFIAPLLVVISGVANISSYFTPEYTNAWAAMFIQSALLYAYYLLPFSMIVVCTMLAGQEKQNNGMLKMLALPVSHVFLCLAKFLVLLFYLLMEIVVFFAVFVMAGLFATETMGIMETLPLTDLFTWCTGLFLTMIPCIAVMWMFTILFEKPLLSVGLNLLLVIPGVLVANTPVWMIYPYCYSGYLVSGLLNNFTTQTEAGTFLNSQLPFILCAVILLILAMTISIIGFGKKEMK